MSDTKKKEYVPIRIILIYSALFYLAWTCFYLFVNPLLDAIQNKALSAFLSNGIIKNIVWTLPAVILIRKYNDKLYVNLKDMLSFKKNDAKYLLIFPAMLAFIAMSIVIHKGAFAINDSFGLDKIIIVLFVGITEEFVFRGWLLNSLATRNEDTTIAVAVTSLMFLLIHFPIWIAQGVFINNFVTLGFVSIIALSILFSEIFLKTKNILLPIGLHMFWDLLVFMLMQQKG